MLRITFLFDLFFILIHWMNMLFMRAIWYFILCESIVIYCWVFEENFLCKTQRNIWHDSFLLIPKKYDRVLILDLKWSWNQKFIFTKLFQMLSHNRLVICLLTNLIIENFMYFWQCHLCNFIRNEFYAIK